MRIILFLTLGLSVCLADVSWAQRSEVGFGLGTFNYTGDLVRTYDFSFSRPAATVFYRSNLSKVVSFRAGFTAGFLGASDRKPIDAFAKERDASFDLFLFEVSTVMEYHFLNWRDEKFLYRFSPYMFAGLGLFGISGNDNKPAEYSNVQAAVPMGMGVKYILNPKWYLALEFGLRKTFSTIWIMYRMRIRGLRITSTPIRSTKTIIFSWGLPSRGRSMTSPAPLVRIDGAFVSRPAPDLSGECLHGFPEIR